jgi:hypothetical protein
VVVVHSRGGFGGVGSGNAPDVLDEWVLKGDRGREKQRVEGAQAARLAPLMADFCRIMMTCLRHSRILGPCSRE